MTENQRENEATIESSLDPAEEYQMGNKRRGLSLIFNQEDFFWRLDLPERRGTNVDRDSLEKSDDPDHNPHYRVVDFRKTPMTVSPVVVIDDAVECLHQQKLKDLNFEVRCYNNLKLEAVLDEIAKASEEDHSDADCFLLAFLSHGEDNHVYCYDGKISIQDMMSTFKGDKCQGLVGKPKIFIIQACRGKEFDVGVTVTGASTTETEENVFMDASTVQTLPAGADFIMCYSVAQGYYSFRDTEKGSWYIQTLCEMLRNYGSSLEFTELLTLVNRKVSLRNIQTPRSPRFIGKKQMPCFASMLTKKLYFRPKK